jgi:glycosyltransferase involved in cell wall biosynthesis
MLIYRAMKVSVITPLYNRIDLLLETLNSVINQTYQNWEFLLVDDGSTDKTIEIVKNFATRNEKIKFFRRNRLPKGAPTCRNIGLEKAMGDYIMFLDSDDLLEPFCFEQRISVAKKYPDFDFYVFQTLRFSKNEQKKVWNTVKKEPFVQFLEIDSPWHTSGSFWKIEALKREKISFDEKLAVWQDVDFHIQALHKKMKYKNLLDTAKPDVLYREHTLSLSQKAFPPHYRKSQIYFFYKWQKNINEKLYKNVIEKKYNDFIERIKISGNYKDIMQIIFSAYRIVKISTRLELMSVLLKIFYKNLRDRIRK